MNHRPRLKKVGIAFALSVVAAEPAHSKILPLSSEKLSSETNVEILHNSIFKEKVIISKLINNLSQEEHQLLPLSSILEKPKFAKINRKKITKNLTYYVFAENPQNSKENLSLKTHIKTNTTNLNNFPKSIINLPAENALPLPTSGKKLTLLPPISEKYTLIDRYELLKKKAENNVVKKEPQFNSIIQEKDKVVQKQEQQTNKNFHEIQQPLTNFAVSNQPEINFTNLKPATIHTQFNLTESFLGEQQHQQVKQKEARQINKIFRLNEIQQPLTSAEGLYQPDIIITNVSENIRIAQQIIQVINIKINSTPEGLQIILETLEGEQLQVNTSVDGNTLIADIPNAVLFLPDTEEFTVNNPATGITAITAKTVDFNSIRVTIVGETNLPTAEVIPSAEGLTLSVTPITEEIEVVISATRTDRKEEDIPRSLTLIPREQIESQGSVSATNSVTDILGRLVPGYGPPNQVERSTRAQNMRGRPALILIDGVVQNSNVSQGTELNTIDPSAIERIEVIRGPSALYGSGGTGGIINIITRDPTEFKLQQQVRVGIGDSIGDETFPGNGITYNSGYTISGNQGVFNWRFQGSLNQNNRFYDADGDVIPLNQLDGTRSLNFLTKLGLNLSENQKLGLSYNLYNDRIFSEIISDPIITAIPGLQKARDLRVGKIEYEEPPEQTNHNLSLTYNHDDLFGSKLYTQFFFQRTDYRPQITDARDIFANFLEDIEVPRDAPFVYQSGAQGRKLGTRFQVNTPLGNSANLLWGFDYTNEKNETEEEYIDPIALDEDREANVVDRFNSVPKFDLNNVGIFTEVNWDVNERLILTGGARYETINVDIEDWKGAPASSIENAIAVLSGDPLPEYEGGTNDTSDIVFNAGVLYNASSAISLFANFTQGFSIPRLDFLGGVAPGFDIETDNLLEAEKVYNYEVGMRGNWESVQFTLAAYYNNTDKGQNLVVGGEGVTELFRGPQRNYGVEATLDWQPAKTWSLGGSFTWVEGEGDIPEDNRSWLALSSLDVQPIKLTLYVENETLPGWRNRLQMLYVGDRDRAFDEEVDGVKIAGYTTFDLISTLDTGFGRWELGVENLFNRQYFPVVAQLRTGPIQEPRRFAAPGRSLSIRYLLNF